MKINLRKMVLKAMLKENPYFMSEFFYRLNLAKEEKRIMKYDRLHPNEKHEIIQII